jgi:hypothetical protein
MGVLKKICIFHLPCRSSRLEAAVIAAVELDWRATRKY